MKTDAALIAGGKSRRFGEDKAFVEWEGKPLWLHQLGKLLRLDFVEQPVWLSTNPTQTFPDHVESVVRLNDTIENLGPLGAFKTIFEASSADNILVLAVDMPLLDRPLLEKLRGIPCRVPKIAGRWEPLAAIYPRKPMLGLIDVQIEKKSYSLQDLLDIAEEKKIISSFEVDEKDLAHFSNINTRTDLAETVHCTQQCTVQCTEDDGTLYRAPVRRFDRKSGFGELEPDFIAAEEPLEVRVNGQSVSVMMRTPGNDEELVAGFLYTENVIGSFQEILEIEAEGEENIIHVRIPADTDLTDLTRHVFTSSSCGVCGKATIDSVFQHYPPVAEVPEIDPDIILSLPKKLRAHQETFEKTGGLHASALFSLSGELLFIREDVGRHNALDKVIGKMLASEKIKPAETMLLVSGRISFELMQKALAARIPIVCGISAPSSLAINLARESGQVLIGFLREKGFNLYSAS